ncbi:hypothetical protein FNM00_00635 [Aeromicrobium piscarium]|uniref:Tape measure protein N-terminal domain-containing protein n=2 Tax=Aeromicrobium piscarium TaxID=2590901 RepID=A0A554SP70_9ACTN|nr:hypothetical protein FNM00_00635 [Aeromicrobium piscarium]
MEQFDAFARNSPFSRQTFLTAQQQMLAFGIETQKVIPYLEAVQDAVAAAGGGNQDIAELTYIMAQVGAAGKITATDLMQFGQRGVDAATLIGSQMGMTGQEIRDSITAGTLDANEALDALAAGMTDRFGGAAANVKDSFDGALDRVKAAWRDLSAELAEPFVSAEGGGILVDLANGVADLMRGFQGLPEPVKASAAALTGITGTALLAGGAFLTLAPKVMDTLRSINRMAEGTDLLSKRMLLVRGSAAAAGMGLMALSGPAGEVNETLGGLTSAAGMAAMGFAVGGPWGAAIGGAIGLVSSFAGANGAAVAEAEALTATLDEQTGALTDNSREMVASALAAAGVYDMAGDVGMSISDMTDAATGGEAAFKRFAEALMAAEAAGDIDFFQMTELLDIVGRQNDAATQATELWKQTGEAMDGATESADRLGSASERAAERFGMSGEEYAKLAEEVNSTASSFFGLGEALNDSEVSLSSWIKSMEDQTKALVEFESNAIEAARRGLDEGLIKSLREAGPEGALRLGQLADASEEEIARANAAFIEGTEKVGEYASSVLTIPDHIYTEFGFPGADEAFDRAAELLQKYDLLDEREVRTFMEQVGFETDDIERMLDYLWQLNQTEAVATARIVGDNAGVDTVNALLDGLSFLDGMNSTPTLEIRDGATQTLEEAIESTLLLDGTEVEPTATFNPRPVTDPAQAAIDRLAYLGGLQARPSVSLSAPGVLATLSQITNMMRGLAMMGPVSLALDVAARVSAANANAIGGFYDGGVRAFAGGGIDERGRHVPRQPQMRSGSQGAVVWGEAETGWEAYVSGKPGMQSRNRAVLGEAAARLGGDVTWYANGGITDAVSPAELTRLRIRVRDLERDLRATGDDRLTGLDRTLAQQELRDAKAELAATTAANRGIRGGHTADSWNMARDRARDFASDFDSSWSSPASLERALAQKLQESAQFTQVLAELKRKGASPWLLEQLIAFGPSKSSIRTAKQLTQDTARLKRLNAMSNQLGQVADVYGQMTSDPRFLQASTGGRWEPLWANQRGVLEQTVNLNVTRQADPDREARELTRLMEYHTRTAAMGAGI